MAGCQREQAELHGCEKHNIYHVGVVPRRKPVTVMLGSKHQVVLRSRRQWFAVVPNRKEDLRVRLRKHNRDPALVQVSETVLHRILHELIDYECKRRRMV